MQYNYEMTYSQIEELGKKGIRYLVIKIGTCIKSIINLKQYYIIK